MNSYLSKIVLNAKSTSFIPFFLFSNKVKPVIEEKKPLFDLKTKDMKIFEKKNLEMIKTKYYHGFTAEELEGANDMIKTSLKLGNASPAQILKYRIDQAIKKFQRHPLDTATAAVQVAVMSEKVIHMANIYNKNRSDKRMLRDLQYLLDKRRIMINYLQRTDYHYFKWVSADYGIPDVLPPFAHHKNNLRGAYNRVQWSQHKGKKERKIPE